VAEVFVETAPMPSPANPEEWLTNGISVNIPDFPRGQGPDATSLASEGDCTLNRAQLVKDFSRFFLPLTTVWPTGIHTTLDNRGCLVPCWETNTRKRRVRKAFPEQNNKSHVQHVTRRSAAGLTKITSQT